MRRSSREEPRQENEPAGPPIFKNLRIYLIEKGIGPVQLNILKRNVVSRAGTIATAFVPDATDCIVTKLDFSKALDELALKAVHGDFSKLDKNSLKIYSLDWITEGVFRGERCGVDEYRIKPAFTTIAEPGHVPPPVAAASHTSPDARLYSDPAGARARTVLLEKKRTTLANMLSRTGSKENSTAVRRKSLSPPPSAAAIHVKSELSSIRRQLSSSSNLSPSFSSSSLEREKSDLQQQRRPLIVDDEGDDDETIASEVVHGVHDAQNPSREDERILTLNNVAPSLVDPFAELGEDHDSEEEDLIAQAFASDEMKSIYSTKIIPLTANKRRKVAEADLDSDPGRIVPLIKQDAASQVLVAASAGDYSMPFFKLEGRSIPSDHHHRHPQQATVKAGPLDEKKDSEMKKPKILPLNYEFSDDEYDDKELEPTEVLPKIEPPSLRSGPGSDNSGGVYIKPDPANFEDEHERSWYMPLLPTGSQREFDPTSMDISALQQGHDSSDDDYASDSHEGASDDDGDSKSSISKIQTKKRKKDSSDNIFGRSEDPAERKKRLAHYARFEGANFRDFIPKPSEAQIKRDERRRASYACQKGPKTEDGGPGSTLANAGHQNLNKHITDVLEKLEETCRTSGDQWRAYAYRRAVQVLKARREKVINAEQARKLRGIGSKIADKIAEILATGTLRKVQMEEHDEVLQTYKVFGKVFGAGPSTVRKWYAMGYRNLDDLKNKATLTTQQQIGVKYYYEFQERIPRAEVEMIASRIISYIQELDPDYIAEVCGSYRRGKPDCGDMDILVTHPREKKLHGLLHQLTPRLHEMGILTDDLTGVRNDLQDKYMGVCWSGLPGAIHRRIDIQVVPLVEWPFALLYFTGSGYFNRSMRLWAQRHGFSLSEHALVRRYGKPNTPDQVKGDPIPGIRTEKDIFDALGLEYKAPHERDV